ncbi:MAG: hypothetical protein NPIRA05_09810 [Nitrospirales bacterium]|nr:MAG: hypothetical protein NPIRA05_09810 [Nitrospirales bacterium]
MACLGPASKTLRKLKVVTGRAEKVEGTELAAKKNIVLLKMTSGAVHKFNEIFE